MQIVQINVVEAQALQRRLDGLLGVLLASIDRAPAVRRPLQAKLASEEDVFTLVWVLLEPFPEQLLAVGVHVRAVPVVAAGLVDSIEHLMYDKKQ